MHETFLPKPLYMGQYLLKYYTVKNEGKLKRED